MEKKVDFVLDYKRRNTTSYKHVYSNYVALARENGYDISHWTMDNVMTLWDYVYLIEGEADENFLAEVKHMASRQN